MIDFFMTIYKLTEVLKKRGICDYLRDHIIHVLLCGHDC